MRRKKLSSTPGRTGYPEGLSASLKSYFFKGVALSGGKTDKTSVANIEYFVNEKKIFLHSLVSKIKAEKNLPADEKLVQILNNNEKKIKYIAVNAPLSLPKCVTCRLKCPGVTSCKEPEIKWHWKSHDEILKKKKKKKYFTPYTERCAEVYISNFLEEKFDVPHAMGANLAPLLARMTYLKKRVKYPLLEVFPKLSLWRIGRSLRIQKSYLRFHKHAIGGEEARRSIVDQLIKSKFCFIYEDDKKLLIEDNQSFDAFICALTGVLKYMGQVESHPKKFPKKEGWIEIPNIDLKL